MRALARVACLASAAWLVAIATGCAAPRGQASRPPEPIGRATFETSRWARVRAPRFELSLKLPDAAAWTTDDAGPFLVASHAPSASSVRVRAWAGPELVTEARCEAHARTLAPDLPKPDASHAVDERRARLGGKVDATVRVTAGPDPSVPGAVRGAVVLVAADVRKCWLFAYVTRASGDHADELVADRLVAASEGMAASIQLETPLDVARELPTRAPRKP